MIELLPTITTAISLANRVKEIGDRLKHAELTDAIADLRLQLASLKIGMADLMEENDSLKRQVARFDSAEGDRCPRCKKSAYVLEKSERDETFGEVGGMMRTYLCSACGFTEQSLVMPS
jgi:uncharacterized protein with PIN domain